MHCVSERPAHDSEQTEAKEVRALRPRLLCPRMTDVDRYVLAPTNRAPVPVYASVAWVEVLGCRGALEGAGFS